MKFLKKNLKFLICFFSLYFLLVAAWTVFSFVYYFNDDQNFRILPSREQEQKPKKNVDARDI